MVFFIQRMTYTNLVTLSLSKGDLRVDRTGKGENIDDLSASMAEYFRAFLDSGPGSVDIVHQEHPFPFQSFGGHNCKRATDIGAAFADAELGLGHSRPRAFQQERVNLDLPRTANGPRQDQGLVKPSPAQTIKVEGHRYNQVIGLTLQREIRSSKTCQCFAGAQIPVVLKALDSLTEGMRSRFSTVVTSPGSSLAKRRRMRLATAT